MRNASGNRLASGVLAVGLAALLPVAAQAQAASDAWKWDLTVYAWLPSIGASASFPPPSPSPSVEVSAQDVIDALKMGFMGTLSAHKGEWGFLTDIVYSDLGGSKSGTRQLSVGQAQLPVGVDANLKLDVKTYVWTTAGSYMLSAKPEAPVDLVFGARLLDVNETLSWTLNGNLAGHVLPPQSGRATVSAGNWDAIVGLRGRFNLGSDGKWFIPYYLDVGTGESKLTWQAVAGVGYRFDWGDVGASWRYLDYNFKSGSLLKNLNMSGIALGATFHW